MKILVTVASLFLGLASLTALAEEKTAGEHVDDGWLHTKVKAAMVGHGSSGVNVEVYKGVVQLAGFLTSESNKKNLIVAVQGVDGVERIKDRLQVVEGGRSAGQVLDDNTLTTAVKATLMDRGITAVNVEVNRGRVLLTGFVTNEEVRKQAESIVEGMERVKAVINGIDLKQ